MSMWWWWWWQWGHWCGNGDTCLGENLSSTQMLSLSSGSWEIQESDELQHSLHLSQVPTMPTSRTRPCSWPRPRCGRSSRRRGRRSYRNWRKRWRWRQWQWRRFWRLWRRRRRKREAVDAEDEEGAEDEEREWVADVLILIHTLSWPTSSSFVASNCHTIAGEYYITSDFNSAWVLKWLSVCYVHRCKVLQGHSGRIFSVRGL